jgi:large subunit ribosomal protein L31
MKADIHPKYQSISNTTCICGAIYTFGTTVQDMKIEICANCHPFYTGLDKTLDATGRVDRFKKRMARAS